MSEKHEGPHKYVRIKIGRNKRVEYRCTIPGCVHHIRPELAIGRFSLCCKCNKQFEMTKASIRLAKPHCLDCSITNQNVKDLAAIFEE